MSFRTLSKQSRLKGALHRKDNLPEGVTLLRSGKYRATYKSSLLGNFGTPEEASAMYQAVKKFWNGQDPKKTADPK